MKKLISLIASLSLVATMVTSVSAAELANNRPVVDTTVRELTNDEYYNDWMEEDIPAGQKAFLVEATVSGLDLESKAQGTSAAKKTKRSGVGLTATKYAIYFESDANIAAVNYMDGVGSAVPSETMTNSWAALGTTDALPKISDGDTTGQTSKGMLLYQAVVTTKGEVTGRVESKITVNVLNGDQFGDVLYCEPGAAVEVAYTVEGVAGNTVKFGASAPAEPIKITKEYGNVGEGYAWDVEVNNYDDTKTYKATFTSGTEKKVNDFDFSKYIEAGGSTTKFSFVTLLKTLKENVQLVVSAN